MLKTYVQEALHAGVSVLATVHGRDSYEVLQRPYVGELIRGQYFERYIVLSNRPRIGTIEEIVDSKGDKLLWCRDVKNTEKARGIGKEIGVCG